MFLIEEILEQEKNVALRARMLFDGCIRVADGIDRTLLSVRPPFFSPYPTPGNDNRGRSPRRRAGEKKTRKLV